MVEDVAVTATQLAGSGGSAPTGRYRYRAVAAVFVQKAALDMPSRQDAIAKLYKLTPTKQRVLFAIVR